MEGQKSEAVPTGHSSSPIAFVTHQAPVNGFELPAGEDSYAETLTSSEHRQSPRNRPSDQAPQQSVEERVTFKQEPNDKKVSMLFDLARIADPEADPGEAERGDVRAIRPRDDTLVFLSEEKRHKGERWEAITLKSDRSAKILGLQS